MSKSSQTAINVPEKLENTVQPVFVRWLVRQEDRGNRNCARADDLTGNSPSFRLWQCSTPNSQVRTCGEEFHVSSTSSCSSLRISPARWHSLSSCRGYVFFHSARILTHPDDSSASASFATQNISQNSIGQQIHIAMKHFTWERSSADSWNALTNMTSLYNINPDGAHDGQQLESRGLPVRS